MERKQGREAHRDIRRQPLLKLARCPGQRCHESLLMALVIRQTRNVNLRQPRIVRQLDVSHGQESQVGVVHHDQLTLHATPYERFKPQPTDVLHTYLTSCSPHGCGELIHIDSGRVTPRTWAYACRRRCETSTSSMRACARPASSWMTFSF